MDTGRERLLRERELKNVKKRILEISSGEREKDKG